MVTWLLDVDGVLNANKPKWHAAPRTKYVHADGDAFKLRWAPKLIDEINDLSNSINIVWATTWVPWIWQIEHTLGIRKKLDCIEWPEGYVESFASRWAFKETAANKVLESNKPLIWTDDDIPEIGPLPKRFDKAGALLIRPKSNTGLTPEDIDRIKDYAAKHSGS